MFAMETDQSMSDLSVKFCNGTHFHLSGVLACVLFKIPNIALTNFEHIYLITFLASFSFCKIPMLKKVSVEPVPGSPIIGIDIVSPKSPFPVAPGKKT